MDKISHENVSIYNYLLPQTIAEIYEVQVPDLDKAMKHYELAAEFFKGEDSNSSAKKCMVKGSGNEFYIYC